MSRSLPQGVKDITQGSLNRAIWYLAGPVIIERLLIMSVGIADVAMVGRFGEAAVAAVGLSNRLIFLSMSLFDAVRIGTTALVARTVGENSYSDARAVGRQSFIISLFIGVFLAALGVPLAAQGLSFIGAEQDVVLVGASFLQYKTLSLIFAFTTMTGAAILRGAGDTKTPMVIAVVVNITNLFLNWVLIFGNLGFPAMGVAGAGLATLLARTVGAVITSLLFLSDRAVLPLRILKEGFAVNMAVIRRIMNVGLPAVGERGLMQLGQLAFTMIIATLGTTALAAHQVALRAESLSFMPGFAFSVAATTLVGQNVGAELPERAEKSGYRCQLMSILIMSGVGVFFFIFARQFTAFFVPGEPEVIALGSKVLRIVAVAQPALASALTLSGALRGAGDTRWVMWITAGSVWLVRVVLSYILVIYMHLGLTGAWLAMVIDLFVRGLLSFLRFRSGGWRKIVV